MRPPSPPLTPSAERGTTLIELIVAMVCSIIVVGALLAILEFSLRQESAIADRVSADQIGRVAMGRIVQELHSSCTGFGATAIQAPSTTPESPLSSLGPLNLWLITAFGQGTAAEAAVLTEVTEHDIKWTETGKSSTGEALGTLWDYSFTGTGTAPNWVFPTLGVSHAKATAIAENVILPAGGNLFRYYEYNSSGAPIELVSASEIKTAASEKAVAEVKISFTQASEPASGSAADTAKGRTASLEDSVDLRFNSTQSGTEVVNRPCS